MQASAEKVMAETPDESECLVTNGKRFLFVNFLGRQIVCPAVIFCSCGHLDALRLGPSASVAGASPANKTDQLLAALATIKELAADPHLRPVIASQLALDLPAVTPAPKKDELPEPPSSGMYEGAQAGDFEGEEGEEEEHMENDPVTEVPEATPPPKVIVNSSTYRKEHARLVRKMASTDEATCPEMVRLWGGNRSEKNELLRKWIQSGENLAACESNLTLERSQEGELEKGKELLTIREMIDKNFSEFLGCALGFVFLRRFEISLDLPKLLFDRLL